MLLQRIGVRLCLAMALGLSLDQARAMIQVVDEVLPLSPANRVAS
jgi:hypothetical protein